MKPLRTPTVSARPTAQQGFTLLEIAIALAVAGLVSWASFSAYETAQDQQERQRAQAWGQEMRAQLRTFSLRHGRLPCPDTAATPTGYETLTAGVCGTGNTMGWFPYVSLGMVLPEASLRARYAVFRAANANPAQDADLAVSIERTGDAIDHANHAQATDLIVALNNVSGLTLTTSQAFLTGDGGIAGPVNCTANAVMNVAYWLVIPLKDRSGDADRLDPPNALNNLCAQSPSAPVRFDSDDVVVSESPVQLAGWLRTNLP